MLKQNLSRICPNVPKQELDLVPSAALVLREAES